MNFFLSAGRLFAAGIVGGCMFPSVCLCVSATNTVTFFADGIHSERPMTSERA